MQLRPYQITAIDGLRRLLGTLAAGKRLAILQAETGAGKTMMALEPIRLAHAKGRRSLFVARGRELVLQASRHMTEMGLPHGLIMSKNGCDLSAPIQIASKDTLLSWAFRRERIDLPQADLVIIDECHESLAKQWLRIIDAYRERSTIIGLTATPCRSDGRGLGDVYLGMVKAEAGPRLIAQGFLVPTKVYAPVTIDMKGVKKVGDDFNAKQVGARLDKPKLVGDVLTHWREHAEGRQTVIYCPTIAVSVHVRDVFRNAGIAAEEINGKTDLDERADILDSFSRENVKVITNVGVLVQGVDLPNISCVVWYTATASLRKFRQGNGRGKRPASGKQDCVIIDHAGNVFRHGMPDEDVPWTLEPSKRIEDVQKERQAKGENPEPIVCPKCHAMFPPQPQCPECQYKFVTRAKAIETSKGKLHRVTASELGRPATFQEKQSFWRSRLAIAINRGMKVGAAAKMYHDVFKEWPDNSFAPPPPFGANWQRLAREVYPDFCRRKKVEVA